MHLNPHGENSLNSRTSWQFVIFSFRHQGPLSPPLRNALFWHTAKRRAGHQAQRGTAAQHRSAMVLLDQPPSPRAATAPDGLPDMEQRVAGLRREIAEEQAAALAVAVQALHPPERSQNMSREALRAVTVLPRCGHGILSAPSQPRRISSARAPMQNSSQDSEPLPSRSTCRLGLGVGVGSG